MVCTVSKGPVSRQEKFRFNIDIRNKVIQMKNKERLELQIQIPPIEVDGLLRHKLSQTFNIGDDILKPVCPIVKKNSVTMLYISTLYKKSCASTMPSIVLTDQELL